MSGVASFNVGRDCTLVMIGPFGRVDFSQVINFSAHQTVNQVRSNPLNSPRLQRDLPGGWDGTFEIDRANSVADDMAAQIETAFWNGDGIPPGTLYQYISELDGSTSTYQYDNVTMNLASAGSFQQEQAVKQTVQWAASRRRRI